MDFFNFRKKQIIKTPMATCEWEPVTNFDRLLTWMWGPPGCAKRKSEHIEPELMGTINQNIENLGNMNPLLSQSDQSNIFRVKPYNIYLVY